MMNQTRHRHRRPRDAAQARADRRARAPTTRARAIRPTAARSSSTRTTPTRSFNDQGRLTLLARRSGRMRSSAPRFDRATTHVAWTPDSRVAAVHRRGSRAASASWRLPSTAARRAPTPGARRRRAAPIGGFAQSRDGARARLRPLDARCIRRRCSRAARDGTGERPIEIVEPRAARAARAGRGARGDGQGLGRRAGADVDHVPAELRSEEEVAAAALDPRRPARRAPRRLALPLEHAGVRRPRLRRRRASTTTARRASGRSGWRRSPAATARRSSPTSRRRPTGCCGRATSTARGSSRPAAATAASWSRT